MIRRYANTRCCEILARMLPIAALSETQTWRDDDVWIRASYEGDRLHVRLSVDAGYDGEGPPEQWQQSRFERAIVGVECVVVDWPTWAMPPDAWPTVIARLEAWLFNRRLRYERSDPALASLLAAELRGKWSARLFWRFGPTDRVSVDVSHTGSLMIAGDDVHLDALLRAHAGLAIDAPPPLQGQTVKVDPATAVGFFERIASWSPHALSWVQAQIDGEWPKTRVDVG